MQLDSLGGCPSRLHVIAVESHGKSAPDPALMRLKSEGEPVTSSTASVPCLLLIHGC